MLDIFYYFDKSTQRKAGLADYYAFCDSQYRKILKHINTRWLSLECVIDRVLHQYAGLRSYFLSESKVFYHNKMLMITCCWVMQVKGVHVLNDWTKHSLNPWPKCTWCLTGSSPTLCELQQVPAERRFDHSSLAWSDGHIYEEIFWKICYNLCNKRCLWYEISTFWQTKPVAR